MRKFNLSVSGLSTTLAMGLALWEVYFFFLAGNTGRLAGTLGIFTPDRLGFNMAWLVLIYLSYQLISIPSRCRRPAPFHRRGGRHGIPGAAGGRPGGAVRQARAARHRRTLGSRDPARLREHGRPVRRLCVQHRAQPPDFRYRRRRNGELRGHHFFAVIAGLVPAISARNARRYQPERDGRNKSGHHTPGGDGFRISPRRRA